MKAIFEIISNFIQITGHSNVDYILLLIIGLIAASVASGLVGIIFDTFGIYDSDLMSDCHWFIRLIVFIGLSSALIEFFKFITWLFSFQWWVYLIATILVIGIIILIFYIKHKFSTKHVKKEELKQIQHTEIKPKTVKQETNKEICPRCGAKLIKRHGPYGNFYGCENFSKTGCKYTRKFK